jgi:carbon-monoxide dehydrogenase large subunit
MSGKVFGSRAARLEDPALLTGRGRFIDDVRLPGTLHAAFVRSPHGHALIRAVDGSAASAMDGVHAVYSAEHIWPMLKVQHLAVGLPSPAYRQIVDRPVIARDEVCHVGDPVAVVIADTRYIAEDAAVLVEVDYEILPVAADCKAALDADSPTVHHGAPNNLLAEYDISYGDTDAAFAGAAHVFSDSLWQHRGCGHAIECRGGLAHFDRMEDRLTLWSSSQAPHTAMRMLVETLGWDETRIRVVTPDIGGGFGPKLVFYPEDVVLAASSILCGHPVKWIEDRREHFLATTQERDQYWEVEIAVDDDAKILGLRGSMIHEHGAYTARGINLAYNSSVTMPLPYVVPNYRMDVRVALTNKVPVTPVRGAGHPQGIFAMERMLDRVARELGLDRAEVRRRNLVPADAMPYRTPIKARGGQMITLDSGDYPACLDDALKNAGYDGFKARQLAARDEGRHIGIGIANYVKGTGRGPFEAVTVRVGPSGRISVYSGAIAMGQGTKTMLAQIVADQLGGDMNNISVTTGDTAAISLGIGGSASRQTVTAGNSAHAAAVAVREKALKIAAHMLETSEQDLEIEGDRIRVKGVPEMSVSLGEAAHAVAGTPGYALPGGIEPGLEDTEHLIIDEMAFASGTHVAEVEVDVETGAVRILRYVIVHDSGRIINPMIVDGQVLGGAAHGIGNALYEWMRFDDDCQPLTTTFAEYLLPSAPEVPHIDIFHHEIPTPINALGVKGVGECGTVASAAVLISAVEDALSPFGVRISQTPLMPSHIVELVQASES